MNNKLLQTLLFSACLCTISVCPSLAQESPVSASDYGSYQPAGSTLGGAVKEEVFRVRRNSPPGSSLMTGSQPRVLTGTIETNKVVVPKVPTLVESANNSAFTPPPPPPAQKKGTYIWGQSALGGYYDATGQIKEVVRGDELYKYGGAFQDGVAVPNFPVTCNFKGHTYRPFIRKTVPSG